MMDILVFSSQNFEGLDIDKLLKSKSSRLTLTVNVDDNAQNVARAIDALQPHVIIVENNAHEIKGVIQPNQFLDVINDQKQSNFYYWTDALINIENQSEFDKDYINALRVEYVYCQQGDHYVINKCPIHRM